MFAGTVGVYTGIKKGAFSISENQREFNEQESGLVENLAMLFSGYTEISWLVRETLTECYSFKCAHQKLVHTPISAIGYLILAGTKDDEGVVISRNRFGEAHEERLNSNNGTWFLV
jgi:acid ceramidase